MSLSHRCLLLSMTLLFTRGAAYGKCDTDLGLSDDHEICVETGLTVNVQTRGSGVDPNGVLVRVNGTLQGRVHPQLFIPLVPDRYELKITDVSSNCTVDGGGLRRIDISTASDHRLTIELNCTSTTSCILHGSETEGPITPDDSLPPLCRGRDLDPHGLVSQRRAPLRSWS